MSYNKQCKRLGPNSARTAAVSDPRAPELHPIQMHTVTMAIAIAVQRYMNSMVTNAFHPDPVYISPYGDLFPLVMIGADLPQ